MQSRQGTTQDFPGQPWSTPYGPVEVVPGITLTAQVEDLAGRFNLNQLVDQYGVIDPQALQAFQNLLELLGLESKWGPLIADWIDSDSIAWPVDGAEDATYLSQAPPYRTANRQITSASELLALPGFGRDRYLKLAPYVTALPRGDFKINVCSAKGAVLDALAPSGESERNYSAMDDQALAKARADGCFPTLAAYQQAFSTSQSFATSLAKMDVAETSNYFRLLSIVDVGSTRFYLYSLLHREQNHIHVIQRSFTAD